MDIFLSHASLFPEQLRQFLQIIGQKVLACFIAVVLPLLLWLGLGEQSKRAKEAPAIHTQEPLRNLIYVDLPAPAYQEVAPRSASNRRGLWEKVCPGWEREVQWDVTTANHKPASGSLLPNVDLSNLRTDLTSPYQTVLPHFCLTSFHLNCIH